MNTRTKTSARKVLITTSSFSQYSPRPLQLLKKAGFEPILNPFGRRLKPEDIIPLLPGVVGLIAATERLDETIFTQAPTLRIISRVGTGTDSIDLAAAEKRQILVRKTPDAPIEAVAELTLALVLATLRKIAIADRALRAGTWKSCMGNLLHQKTVGLIGLGRIGRRVVELLQPFHVRVMALEPHPDKAFLSKYAIKRVPLKALLRAADVISLHVSLNAQTRGLIGNSEIKQMKPTAILINTARGELVDDCALADALQSGRLGGAGIDVFATEPYQGPLIECTNTILTCHMGTYAEETRNLMEIQAVENLIDALKAEKGRSKTHGKA